MVYIVISTCLESNLFAEWDFLGGIPWMRATLCDFYANVLLIFLYVIYREPKVWVMILWALLFFFLGSIATILYVLIQLQSLKPNDSLATIFEPKKK